MTTPICPLGFQKPDNRCEYMWDSYFYSHVSVTVMHVEETSTNSTAKYTAQSWSVTLLNQPRVRWRGLSCNKPLQHTALVVVAVVRTTDVSQSACCLFLLSARITVLSLSGDVSFSPRREPKNAREAKIGTCSWAGPAFILWAYHLAQTANCDQLRTELGEKCSSSHTTPEIHYSFCPIAGSWPFSNLASVFQRQKGIVM